MGLCVEEPNDEVILKLNNSKKSYQKIIDDNCKLTNDSAKNIACKNYLQKNSDVSLVLLETAHPAKFNDTIEETLDWRIALPKQPEKVVEKEKKSILMINEYSNLNNYLLSIN